MEDLKVATRKLDVYLIATQSLEKSEVMDTV